MRYSVNKIELKVEAFVRNNNMVPEVFYLLLKTEEDYLESCNPTMNLEELSILFNSKLLQVSNSIELSTTFIVGVTSTHKLETSIGEVCKVYINSNKLFLLCRIDSYSTVPHIIKTNKKIPELDLDSVASFLDSTSLSEPEVLTKPSLLGRLLTYITK